MIRLRLAGKSLLNRRATVLLTVLSLTIGIMLVLGITHVRSQVKESFNNTLSGTDLIVGARGGALNLLLYSVFHMGGSTHTVRWQTYEELVKHSQVKWAVPLAMGDSHKGHRVVATTPDFFAHYAYGKKQPLAFAQGKAFAGKYDVVIGAAVARKLHYQVGDKIVLAHGIAEVSLAKHDESPFVVTGILAPTGTPVDKSLYISLAGMAAIHEDWQSGVHIPAAKKQSPITQHAHDDHEHSHADVEKHHAHDYSHEHEQESEHEAHDHHAHDQSLSAIFVGLQSRAATFTVQRQINQYTGEPLQAIVPGLALAELWQLVGSVEVAFNVIAWLVVLASLLGMVASILTALNERQREFAILRSLGAHPLYIVSLVIGEVFLLAASAIALAIILLVLLINALQPWLLGVWGLSISADILGRQQLEYIAVFFAVALAMAIIPAVIAYRRSLNDGLSVRQ
ncbi:ABC transporter permease [Cellvibrio sp. UBA7661]|uniref:ABC transporter permease n=1 Tax=Cellvibrio sp. UBA7661 TaxID=1946311 RepID=UPI002F35C022